MSTEDPSTYQLVPLDSIEQAQRIQFQRKTARQDPLFRPLPLVRVGEGVASLGPDEEMVGVAWCQPSETCVFLDIRVGVEHRRNGLGTELMHAVLPEEGKILALCDSGQRSALQFMDHHDFQYETSVFAYRWDGEMTDVPPSFQTAHITRDDEAFETWARFRGEAFDLLPNTIKMLRPRQDDELLGFVARKDDEVVGSITAVRGHIDFGVLGLWVDPAHRKFGIARLLMCAMLGEATRRGVGVVVHLDASQDGLADQMKGLGFWTYRTWQCFALERNP